MPRPTASKWPAPARSSSCPSDPCSPATSPASRVRSCRSASAAPRAGGFAAIDPAPGGTLGPWNSYGGIMEPVIELDGLEVRFGSRVILKRLSAALNGRAVGLLGPNGAGKSTLLNTLLGFHPPSAGTARIFGKDIRTDARATRALIGNMPENDAFIASMSGVRFVRLMAELSGLPRAQALERAHEAFFYVGLGEARYRNLGTYSLGMKQ